MLEWFRLGFRLRPAGQTLVLLGLVFLGIFGFSLGAIFGTYQGTQLREFARSPGFVAVSPSGEPDGATRSDSTLRLLWVPSWGPEAAHGYLLDPVRDQAPKPPGLADWLAPGEVALSPALAERYPSVSPWGKVFSVIPDSALSNPREFFFYSRPAGPLPSSWGSSVTSFAAADLPVNGDGMNLLEPGFAQLFFGFFLAVPGVSLVFAGLFQASRVRETAQLFASLGLSKSRRFAFGLGSMTKPLAVAPMLILPGLLLSLGTPISIPLVDVTLVPLDIDEGLAIVVAVSVSSWLLTLLLAGLNGLLPYRPLSGRPWSARLNRASQASILVSLAAAAAFVAKPDLQGLPLQIVFFAAVLSFALAIPVVSLWLSEIIGSIAHRLSSSGAGIIAARKQAAHSTSIMSLLFSVSAVLVTIGAAQLYSLQLSTPMQDALRAKDALGNTVMVVKVPGFSFNDVDDLIKEIPSLGGALQISATEPETGLVQIQADESARRLLKLSITQNTAVLPMSNQRGALIFSSLGARIQLVDRLDEPPASVLLLGENNLEVAQISRIATARGAVAGELSGDWLAGAKLLFDKVNWFVLFGCPAAVALMISATGAAIRHASTRLAFAKAVSIFGLSRTVTAKIVVLVVFVPVMTASAMAVVAYRVLALGFAGHSSSVAASAGFQIVLLISGLVVASYLSVVTYLAAVRDQVL